MKDDYIIPDQEKKKVKKGLGKKAGYKFIIQVDSEDLPKEIQEEITIDDIVAICRVNGESIRKKPGHIGPSREGEARGTGNKGRDSEKGKGKSGHTGSSREGKGRETGYAGDGSSERDDDPDRIGGGYVGGSSYGGSDGQTPKSKQGKEKQEEKDEDEKKKRVFLGKAIKIGSSLLAAAILIGAIATTRVERRETEIQRGDKANVESVSDILTTEIEGETITIPGSVIKNPGELISAQKDRYEGEIQVTDEGREQFERETPEERARQEDEIMEITQEFNEQQKIIHDAEEVIQDPNATDAQKKAAIERITEAKKEELRIYMENEQLFKEYNEKAEEAYSIGGGDKRTAGEIERAKIEDEEYGIAMENLERDILSLSSTLGVLKGPEVLFDEVAPDSGTTTEKYVIDMELFGKPVKIWQSEKKFYISVDYDTDIKTLEGHQVGEGMHVVTADEIAEVESTYGNIHAVIKILERLLGHEYIGKVKIYGIPFYGDQGSGDSQVIEVNR